MYPLFRNVTMAALGVIMTVATAAYSVTGIGVSDMKTSRYTLDESRIKIHFIEDNQVTHTHILDSFRVRAPVLNTKGTHVAYMRMRDDKMQCVVTPVSREGSGPVKVLATWDGPYARAKCQWPQGDWVYYGRCEAANDCDGDAQLWKVNVHDTTRNEMVVEFSNYCDGGTCKISELKMDAWAEKVVLNTTGGNALIDLTTSDGDLSQSLYDVGGCGNTISPSGTYEGSNQNSGHTTHPINTLLASGEKESACGLWLSDWNIWCVNAEYEWDVSHNKLPDEFVLRTGYGCLGGHADDAGNSFSANSDKWICLVMGWWSRFNDCGSSNIALVNWQDSISLNLTNYAPVEHSDCPSGFTTYDTTKYDPMFGHFWVKSPREDVVAELRDDLDDSTYAIAGLDSAVYVNEPMKRAGVRHGSMVRVTGAGIHIRNTYLCPVDVWVGDIRGRRLSGRANVQPDASIDIGNRVTAGVCVVRISRPDGSVLTQRTLGMSAR